MINRLARIALHRLHFYTIDFWILEKKKKYKNNSIHTSCIKRSHFHREILMPGQSFKFVSLEFSATLSVHTKLWIYSGFFPILYGDSRIYIGAKNQLGIKNGFLGSVINLFIIVREIRSNNIHNLICKLQQTWLH